MRPMNVCLYMNPDSAMLVVRSKGGTILCTAGSLVMGSQWSPPWRQMRAQDQVHRAVSASSSSADDEAARRLWADLHSPLVSIREGVSAAC